MNLLRTSLAAASLSLASVAMAQSFQPGIHGGLNIPLGDLGTAVDDRFGLTFGGHLGVYYGNGHELRPRVDYTRFNGGYFPAGGGRFDKNTISAWGVGADYLYYTEQRLVGPYLAMGLGYQWWDVSPRDSANHSNSAMSFAAGGGFRFNRTFAVEARFTTGQFQDTNGAANAIQVLGTMRF